MKDFITENSIDIKLELLDRLDNKVNVNPNQILSSDLPVIQINPKEEKKIEYYLESNVHNDISFTDTYPFTDTNWNITNIRRSHLKRHCRIQI